MPVRRLGDFDPLSVVEDAANAVADIGPLRDLMTGPVRDFARSTVGSIVLTALVTVMTSDLAVIVGPQLATVAFALPGMLRGERFDEAWVSEFGSRVRQAATIIAGQQGGAIADYVGEIANELPGVMSAVKDLYDHARPTVDAMVSELEASGASDAVTKLADQLGVREDVVAMAAASAERDWTLLTKLSNKDIDSDPVSGQMIPYVPVAPAVLTVRKGDAGPAVIDTRTPCQEADDARAFGQSTLVQAVLDAKCQAWRDAQPPALVFTVAPIEAPPILPANTEDWSSEDADAWQAWQAAHPAPSAPMPVLAPLPPPRPLPIRSARPQDEPPASPVPWTGYAIGVAALVALAMVVKLTR